MNTQDLRQHTLDFLKGLLAVVLVNAALAALQYIGGHIPDAIQYLTQTAAAVAAVKTHNV